MTYYIGIDIGGTFTDCAVLDGDGRIVAIAKAPTTRGEQDRGVMAAVVSAVGFFIAMYVIDLLAPTFGSEKNLPKSAQLVAYAMTPGYIASLLSFVPALSLLLLGSAPVRAAARIAARSCWT